jgi:hypothetical protein
MPNFFIRRYRVARLTPIFSAAASTLAAADGEGGQYFPFLAAERLLRRLLGCPAAA